MKRLIVKREYWTDVHCRAGEGSVMLTLECGHIVRKKQSEEPENYCLCKECNYENH